MNSPRYANAPNLREAQGEAEDQQGHHADSSILQWTADAWAEPVSRAERCGLAQRRRRLRTDAARSRASRELDAILAEMYPSETQPPSTYGMTGEQRRAYAAYLLEHGWTAWEVRARIAAPEQVAA